MATRQEIESGISLWNVDTISYTKTREGASIQAGNFFQFRFESFTANSPRDFWFEPNQSCRDQDERADGKSTVLWIKEQVAPASVPASIFFPRHRARHPSPKIAHRDTLPTRPDSPAAAMLR